MHWREEKGASTRMILRSITGGLDRHLPRESPRHWKLQDQVSGALILRGLESHQLSKQRRRTFVRYGGRAVETDPAGFAEGCIERREAALIFHVEPGAVIGEELHH